MMAMAAAHPTHSASYVLLSLGQRRLLLPQQEVHTLESVWDMVTTDRPQGGVGWLPYAGDSWPVYGLDEMLNPLSDVPANQRICALLNLDDRYMGLLCTDIATIPGSAIHPRPLPQAMYRPVSPIVGLVQYEDDVGLVSTAAALATFLGIKCQA